MQTIDVYFNNLNLNSLTGVRIVSQNSDEMPARVLNTSKLARQDRSVLTSAEYQDKSVFVTGFIGGATHLVAETNFQRLKGVIQDIEGIVRIPYADTQVEYVGTLNSISKEYIGVNIKVTLEFKCSNPIGRDTTGQNLFPDTTFTTSTKSIAVTIDGSFKAKPRFKVIINSGTGMSGSKNITIANGTTGQGIRITGTFLAGDIISVNSDTFEVLQNTTPIDFTGQFPVFLPGPRTIQYIDDFTTRNVTLQGLYQRQYA